MTCLNKCDIHGSVHRKLLSRNTNRMQLCNTIYYSKFFLKAQHVSSGPPLIIRSSKLCLHPLVYMPIWWQAVANAEWALMSGGPLETCWAFRKIWNNKFYYKAASCWYFYWVSK